MNFRSLLSASVVVVAITIAGTYEARALKNSDLELAHAQRAADALQQQLAIARRANALAHDSETVAALAVASASSPFVSTGDAVFDAEGRELLRRVYMLRKRIDHGPSEWMPEIRHARDSDWFNAVTLNTPWSDLELAVPASVLRAKARIAFLGSVQRALDAYVEENNGTLPKNIRDLAAYFAGPCDEAALARYEMTATGRLQDVPKDTPVLGERMSPSEMENSQIGIFNDLPVRLKGPDTGTLVSRAQEKRSRTIFQAIEKYQESHGGDWPTDTQQLRPYVTDLSVLDGIKMIEHGFSYRAP
jgi:hypothetical protein